MSITADLIPFSPPTITVERPSFWSIADALEAYHESLALVDAQLASLETTPAESRLDAFVRSEERATLTGERVDCLQHIERLSEALVKKTDDLAGVIRRMGSDIRELSAEEKRLNARRKAAEAALDSLKGYTGRTMIEHGWKHLKTAQNTIALQRNGGVAPLAIAQPDLIPDELCEWHGKLSWPLLREMFLALEAYSGWSLEQHERVVSRFTRVPSNTLIREALLQPCATCDGAGDVESVRHTEAGTPYDWSEHCSTCGGSGRNSVPGAHLEERKMRVEVR